MNIASVMFLTSFKIAERDEIVQLLCSQGHCLCLSDLCHCYLGVMGLLERTCRVGAIFNPQKMLTHSEGGQSIYHKL